MKIAIYGGSFNPPHLGHLEAAKTVCAELAPDRRSVCAPGLVRIKPCEDGLVLG